MTAFTLQPFASPHPDITISGTLDRNGEQLAIAYTVSGHLEQVRIPSPSLSPTRQYNLWEATCLEFFLGLPNQPHYWEFNLSPAGDWNVFHLEDYRQNLREALAVDAVSLQVASDASRLTLSLRFNLADLMAPSQPLEVGICAVIQSAQGQLSYWALTHPGSEADFHRRESFILQI
ncbi:DOMON-like domain-containing protein [Acaryochloris sp. IP29b_bin.148]|uniref:DOMON-like domain-containing protein n=1 Tax=Acaryochloris sp. IP29b_bin.148 TaxID=2969218 RepID=UPI0026177D3B|nr:DOMON-like domain-containing protein [Acaryochloris sp. IP29b_bin.148]